MRCILAAAVLFCCAAGPAVAADGPSPPCGGRTDTKTDIKYADLGAPATLRVWRAGSLGALWTPPDCLEWSIGTFGVLIAVAGRFDGVPDTSRLLHRLATVSRLKTIRYWSFTRKKWRNLLTGAGALKSSDRTQERADFASHEFQTSHDYFTWQKENSLASGVVLRTRFKEISDRKIVFDQVNLTASRILTLTVLEPNGFQSRFFIEREYGDVWRYYSLTRFGAPERVLSDAQLASVINRNIAIYRYLGGLPMEREPPGAP